MIQVMVLYQSIVVNDATIMRLCLVLPCSHISHDALVGRENLLHQEKHIEFMTVKYLNVMCAT